jgi:hypothetical protein
MNHESKAKQRDEGDFYTAVREQRAFVINTHDTIHAAFPSSILPLLNRRPKINFPRKVRLGLRMQPPIIIRNLHIFR